LGSSKDFMVTPVPRFARFLKLYWTEVATGGGKVIADPVRVEFFQGPRIYDVFKRVAPPVVQAGVQRTIAAKQRLEVPGDRTYIELIARTKESLGRRQHCEDQIDRVVTQLSALLSPALFAQEVWSGWLSDSEQVIGDLWLMTAPPIAFKPDALQVDLANFRGAIARDADIDRRFTLMSKLFARAVATPPGEERFLWLWTVLEVFPMRDTANIQPISEHLARTIGRPVAEVKQKLDLGRLFGARSALVHDGRLPYGREQLGEVLKRLEAIDVTVLRSLGGLPYAGQVDEYLS
jgi:hypothetical protein